MPVLTEVEIVKIREWYATIHVGEIGVLDVWEMGQTMTQLALKDVPNLLDTIDAKEKRIKVLEEALRGIRDYDGNVGEGNYKQTKCAA